MQATSSLAATLRLQTAGLHQAVEDAVGLPASVRSQNEYAALLRHLLTFHRGVQRQLDAARWSADWNAAGIVLADHARVELLVDDLSRLDAATANAAATPTAAATATAPLTSDAFPAFDTFGEALGCLYVVEGSSLGGRVLAPALRATLGDVPLTFYESDGRNHPKPWRSLLGALSWFEESGGDSDAVLRGAVTTFEGFRDELAAARWQIA